MYKHEGLGLSRRTLIHTLNDYFKFLTSHKLVFVETHQNTMFDSLRLSQKRGGFVTVISRFEF